MNKLVFALVATIALGACATTGARLSDSERLAIYRAHAGAPVRNFHYFGSLHDWAPLGDRALVVWRQPHRAYLLTLASTCPDLEYARAITFSDQSGSVFAGFDDVLVLGQQTYQIPCRIQQIQPVDTRAAERAEREARAADEASGGY